MELLRLLLVSFGLSILFIAVDGRSKSMTPVERPDDSDEKEEKPREDCDCVTSGGRCMHTGDYQCYFSDGPSIVQCNQAGKWTLVSKCEGTCKTLHNDRPYCL